MRTLLVIAAMIGAQLAPNMKIKTVYTSGAGIKTTEIRRVIDFETNIVCYTSYYRYYNDISASISCQPYQAPKAEKESDESERQDRIR